MPLPTAQTAISSLVMDTLRASHLSLPYYEALLRDAECETPPPYGAQWYGEAYRGLAMDPNWLAGSLMANAVKEADGASQLKLLVSKTPVDDRAAFDQVTVHMQDEASHAKFFLRLLSEAFPDADVAPTLLADVERLIPDARTVDEHIDYPLFSFLDEMCQINIGEIRTKVHQLLLEPMILEHAKLGLSDSRVKRMMTRLIADEGRHITYTAEILEQYSQNPDCFAFMRRIFKQRFDRFNEITLVEIGHGEAAL